MLALLPSIFTSIAGVASGFILGWIWYCVLRLITDGNLSLIVGTLFIESPTTASSILILPYINFPAFKQHSIYCISIAWGVGGEKGMEEKKVHKKKSKDMAK